MEIFEIVETNGAIIHANSELGFFITWNGSATFQWWNARGVNRSTFEAVDIRTVYNVETLKQAEAEAQEWAEYELSMVDYYEVSNVKR